MDERAAAFSWDSFWNRVDRRAPHECWPWTGYRNQNGYGQISVRVNGKVRVIQAHRVVWEWLIGPIPRGRTIDHLCQNRACVNPSHLNVVSQMENNRRGALLRVTDAPSAGLGTRLRTCRLSRGLTASDVARAVGVSPHSVLAWERGQKPHRSHLLRLEAFLIGEAA